MLSKAYCHSRFHLKIFWASTWVIPSVGLPLIARSRSPASRTPSLAEPTNTYSQKVLVRNISPTIPIFGVWMKGQTRRKSMERYSFIFCLQNLAWRPQKTIAKWPFLLLRDDFSKKGGRTSWYYNLRWLQVRLQNRTQRFFVNELWHYFVFMTLSRWGDQTLFLQRTEFSKDLCDLPCWIGQDREWATERSETQTQLLSLSGQTSWSAPHPTQPCPSHISCTPRSTQVCPSRGSQILRFNPIAGQIVAH